MASDSSPIGSGTTPREEFQGQDSPRSVTVAQVSHSDESADAAVESTTNQQENADNNTDKDNTDKESRPTTTTIEETPHTDKEMSNNNNANINDVSNNDNGLMGFTEDNYSTLLTHLDHANTTSTNAALANNDNDHDESQAGNDKRKEVNETRSEHSTTTKQERSEENLDILLQQYHQNVMQGSNDTTPGNNSSSIDKDKFANRRTCDTCKQKHIRCVYVPDIGNCIECETKKRKCTFDINYTGDNIGLSGKRSGPSMATDNSNRKKTRTDEETNLGPNEMQNEYYSNFLQSLNTSIGHQGTSPGQFDPLINQRELLRPHSQPAVDKPRKMSVPHHSMSQKILKKQQQQPHVQYPRSSFYVGPTSIYDMGIVDRIKLDNIDQIQISKTLSLRKVAPKVQFLLSDDYNQKLYSEQEQEVDMVEQLVHPHGSLLVEIFFKRVHPYFPILHERVFLEKYLRSYRELTTPLLASIYSLALQWWDFHPKLIGFAKPDVVELLNDIAFKTFFERIERPKLSMVQTGLLLLQCKSESKNNWVLCSNVVALAEELGLGVSCQDWKLPKWEKDLRKRLAWAVWSTDKWISLIEGRHSHLILGRNWMVNVLKRSDFPSTSPMVKALDGLGLPGQQPGAGPPFSIGTGNLGLYDMSLTNEKYQDGTLMFQQMVSLSIIVGEIMDTFYTQGAIHVNTNIEQVLKLAKPLQLKLREWYHSLPKQLSMNNFTEKKFNSNATLTLIYFAAEITLHRKIISSLQANTPPELMQVCRTAAKTRLVAAIEFVGDLKNEHISSFWYGCSTGNLMLIGTFAALLYVTAPTNEESVVFRDLMRNYMWVLRVRSKSFDKLRNAFENIHMFLAQIPGLLTDDDQSNTMSDRNVTFRTPDMSNGTNKIINKSRPPLNANNPISQDILNGLSNLTDNTSHLNSFTSGTDLEAAILRDNNFHHGSPSSYASTPTIEHELNVNMVQEHRTRMNNRSNPALFGENQSPKLNMSNPNMSPSSATVHTKPQFSPGKNHQSPSPVVSKPSESPVIVESMDSRPLNNEKRGSKTSTGSNSALQANVTSENSNNNF
ncbi:Fungal specific transcription factor [Maudiozyma exigua]|uniref:Fungal specific transcription factor n=1 Tax=Maudiozyma exigua TaxID=34358 RepID=A0A9P7BE53_MAUEX|nr:Fungal specific transcription factor [Kazachstania exigua]